MGPKQQIDLKKLDINHVDGIHELLESELEYTNKISKVMHDLVQDYPYMKDARANACIFVLCRSSDLSGILSSMSTLELTFNHKYNYPYVFVNDVPFTEEFKKVVSEATNSKTEFGLIPKEHWSLQYNIDENAYAHRLQEMCNQSIIYGDSRSYRFMYRYNSRFFINILLWPSIDTIGG